MRAELVRLQAVAPSQEASSSQVPANHPFLLLGPNLQVCVHPCLHPSCHCRTQGAHSATCSGLPLHCLCRGGAAGERLGGSCHTGQPARKVLDNRVQRPGLSCVWHVRSLLALPPLHMPFSDRREAGAAAAGGQKGRQGQRCGSRGRRSRRQGQAELSWGRDSRNSQARISSGASGSRVLPADAACMPGHINPPCRRLFDSASHTGEGCTCSWNASRQGVS